MAKIHPELLGVLKTELGIKQRRVYGLIEEVTRATLLSPDLAAAALAWQKGINIRKFVDQEGIQKIRESVARMPSSNNQIREDMRQPPKRRIGSSSPKLGFVDPFIDNRTIYSSIRNAELYPVVYLFENSVRRMIAAVMEKEFGKNWWDTQVHPSIRQAVEIRRNEERGYPWHSRRGAKPVYYTDISDLRRIINSHNRIFAKAFGKIPRVELWIEEIEKTRNTLAHNNPISRRDRERLLVYARDWSEFAKSVFPKL